jgi:hypothetical protein
MTDPALHASRVAAKKHRLSFIVAGIAGIFMAVTGTLGTGEAPLITRLFFWIIVMEAGALIGMAVETGVSAWGRLIGKPVMEGALMAVLITLPLTLIVVSMRSLSFDVPLPSRTGMVYLFGYVLFVSLIMIALSYGLKRPEPAVTNAAAPVPVEASSGAADERFRERLPVHLRCAQILALQSEDHYLRVHCDGGDALILMRLSDAIGEMAQGDGAQTHRGWWVARSAVQAATRGDGKAVLTLSNGVEAPVSRSYYKVINDAGWLR